MRDVCPAPSLILLYHMHPSSKIREFFEEIQDSHFPGKKGYFGTHIREFGGKGVNFDVQCFTVKMGVHLGCKVSVLPQKRGFILDWKVGVLSRKRGRFELKSQCFHAKKGGNFQTGEQGWVSLFPVSEGAGDVGCITGSKHHQQRGTARFWHLSV